MGKQSKTYATTVSQAISKASKFISTPKRQRLIYKIALVLSVVLLLLTTLYAGMHSSRTYSTDSNAIILTQQLGKGVQFPVKLPGPHATVLILPLIYLQGHLPFHYASFALVNVALVLITMVAWAILLIKLFGRRYEIPILILLSSLIFTSVAFSLSIGYTTIRNVEYPIALWFVFIISRLLRRQKYSRKEMVLAAIGCVLFAITLAGDSLFNYAILIPLLFVIAWYWIQSQEFTVNMVKAIALIAGVFIGSVILKKILSAAGLIIFDYTFWGHNMVLGSGSLGPSFTVALQQLLQLHGANVFGQIVYYHNLSLFLNFGLLIAAVVGLILIMVHTNRNYRNKKGLTDNNNYVVAVMAIAFFVTFLVYTLSGYAITTVNGQIISDQNARYISLLPLISVISIVWLIKTYYQKHVAFVVVLLAALILSIASSHHYVSDNYNSGAQNLELTPSKVSIDNIDNILKTNGVTQVAADYWYGPVISFWTNGSIRLAPEVGCTPSVVNTPINTQYTKNKNIKSALIIDRGGLNYSFWSCSDPQLSQIYGQPSKQIVVPGAALNTIVEIWIYNYDIR